MGKAGSANAVKSAYPPPAARSGNRPILMIECIPLVKGTQPARRSPIST